jgi:hypothetical protein
MSSLVLKLEHISLTYLLHSLTVTIDVFSDVEAGAHFIDSPYAFPTITFYKLNRKHNIYKQIWRVTL